MKRFFPGVIFFAALLFAFLSGPGIALAQRPLAPPGPNDLVVFMAQNKPDLYRLAGNSVQPWGTAKLSLPQSLVADPKGRCFYCLDKPSRLDQEVKIWRIGADGQAAVFAASRYTAHGGVLSDPMSLSIDPQGGLFLSDAVGGLWRVRDGRFERLLDGRARPLRKLTASAATPSGQVLLASSYQYEFSGGEILNLPTTPDFSGVGNSTGRQVPVHVWHNQGGLFAVDLRRSPPAVTGLIVNQNGPSEKDTLWRTLRQILVDSRGHVLLVDEGSKKTFGGGTHKSTSIINGGIFHLGPDGAFEDLTFKTPNRSSAPMRRPSGIAQWDGETYIVADPEMYVEGGVMEGAGGLLLLRLDGSRDPRWRFGWRLKASGVAILRQ